MHRMADGCCGPRNREPGIRVDRRSSVNIGQGNGADREIGPVCISVIKKWKGFSQRANHIFPDIGIDYEAEKNYSCREGLFEMNENINEALRSILS